MSDISTKLQYLNTTKGKIKDVINMTGANITSDTTFRNYAKKLYDGYVSVLKDKNTLLDNMPKGTSTGYITDAADLPVYEDKMSKESTQTQISGKNKIGLTDGTYTNNNKNAIISNGILHFDGDTETNDVQFYIPLINPAILKANKTYTLSVKASDGSTIKNYAVAIRLLTTNVAIDGNSFGGTFGTIMNKNVSLTATLTEDTTYNYAYIFLTPNLTGFNFDLYWQVEEGDTATDYIEYVGGTDSPNPDYPQEVKTVKGYRNLFDKDNANILNVLITNTGAINSNASTRTLYIPCNPNTTYTISKISSPRFVVGTTSDIPSAGSSTLNFSDFSTATLGTITTGNNAQYLLIYYYNSSGTATEQEILDSIMITEGTEELPYVPYGTNWIYKKIVGKNLFDKDTVVNGYLNTNGTISSNNSYRVSDYVYVGNLEEITISGNAGTSEVNCFYDENKVFILANGMGTNTSKTISVPSNAKYIRCTINSNNLDQYQLEKNSIVTTYESYKENIITLPLRDNEIAGKGDYKDEYIIDKNGHCWLNKKMPKVVLDGSETYYYSSYVSPYYRIQIPQSNKRTNSIDRLKSVLFSNYFDAGVWNKGTGQGDSVVECYGNTSIFFIINKSMLSDVSTSVKVVESFKNWLSTHNTEVYYALETPQLIDLNYDVDLTLFEGVNNISNSEDMDMEIKYIKESYE